MGHPLFCRNCQRPLTRGLREDFCTPGCEDDWFFRRKLEKLVDHGRRTACSGKQLSLFTDGGKP